MILTVTLNTALDITYRVPRLRPHATHRVTRGHRTPRRQGPQRRPGARRARPRDVVTGFAGGATGAALRDLLARHAGVTDALVPVAGTTRRTLAVVDDATGDTTQLNEPGPLVTPAEWAAFLDAYARPAAREAGRSPCAAACRPGVPVGAYAHWSGPRTAPASRSSSTPAANRCAAGIAARPDLVKPNADELAELTGSREPLRAARDARRRGAHAVVASLGADGLLAVTPEGVWQAAPPPPVAGNPTGAGDSAVAGLLSGLVEGLPWPDRLARAVALSAATVLAPAAGEFDRAAYEELLGRVAVTEHDAAA